jgi:hypothetical protein
MPEQVLQSSLQRAYFHAFPFGSIQKASHINGSIRLLLVPQSAHGETVCFRCNQDKFVAQVEKSLQIWSQWNYGIGNVGIIGSQST